MGADSRGRRREEGSKPRFLIAVALVLVATGCSRTEEQVREPDRTVSVIMRDDNTYDPAEVEVSEGETIAFEVENQGQLVHEFLIGDEQDQLSYGEQMENGGHEAHEAPVPGLALDPGKKDTFTYVVPPKKAGLLFGCHQPGHYEAGMRGELRYRS